MSLSQHAADAITRAAGWAAATPDDQGIFHFHLEENLDMDFFCPDGRTGIFLSILTTLPDQETEADQLVLRCAQYVVSSSKKHTSILSLKSGRIQLHRTLGLDRLSKEELSRTLPVVARDFLNDLAWWHSALGNQEGKSTLSSPFSITGMSANWSLRR